jgi:hypothetical protein
MRRATASSSRLSPAQPGVVAELTREFHDAFKDAGIPPGFFDVAGAHEHAGSVEECLAALGG